MALKDNGETYIPFMFQDGSLSCLSPLFTIYWLALNEHLLIMADSQDTYVVRRTFRCMNIPGIEDLEGI